MKLQLLRGALIGIIALSIPGLSTGSSASAQRTKRPQAGTVCGDPTVACKTSVTFDANDLPFRVPATGAIWESQQFYAVILSSVGVRDGNCEVFISEGDRLAAQALFPKSKVFTSRCETGGGLFYTSVAPDTLFMAVYAGTTKAQADKMLAIVKGTGRFPGANIRRMKAGFNGT